MNFTEAFFCLKKKTLEMSKDYSDEEEWAKIPVVKPKRKNRKFDPDFSSDSSDDETVADTRYVEVKKSLKVNE